MKPPPGALLALLAACTEGGPGWKSGPPGGWVNWDSTDSGLGSADGSDGGGDGSDGSDGSDGVDSGDPDPSGVEVCYPGPDGAGSTCLPVFPADSAWGSDYAYPDPLDDRYLAPVRFLDLEREDAELAIAANFVLGEFLSPSKGRWGVFQPHAVQSLQWIRESIGAPLSVNSGYRSPGYNAGVDGSATYSRHMYGDAADIRTDALSIDDLADLCVAWGAGYVGTYESHVHCDWRDDPLEPAFFDADLAARAAPVRAETPAATLQRGADGRFQAPATGFSEGEPHRRWRAFDAMGAVVGWGTGRVYAPPAVAAAVEVRVGRQLVLRQALPPG